MAFDVTSSPNFGFDKNSEYGASEAEPTCHEEVVTLQEASEALQGIVSLAGEEESRGNDRPVDDDVVIIEETSQKKASAVLIQDGNDLETKGTAQTERTTTAHKPDATNMETEAMVVDDFDGEEVVIDIEKGKNPKAIKVDTLEKYSVLSKKSTKSVPQPCVIKPWSKPVTNVSRRKPAILQRKSSARPTEEDQQVTWYYASLRKDVEKPRQIRHMTQTLEPQRYGQPKPGGAHSTTPVSVNFQPKPSSNIHQKQVVFHKIPFPQPPWVQTDNLNVKYLMIQNSEREIIVPKHKFSLSLEKKLTSEMIELELMKNKVIAENRGLYILGPYRIKSLFIQGSPPPNTTSVGSASTLATLIATAKPVDVNEPPLKQRLLMSSLSSTSATDSVQNAGEGSHKTLFPRYHYSSVDPDRSVPLTQKTSTQVCKVVPSHHSTSVPTTCTEVPRVTTLGSQPNPKLVISRPVSSPGFRIAAVHVQSTDSVNLLPAYENSAKSQDQQTISMSSNPMVSHSVQRKTVLTKKRKYFASGCPAILKRKPSTVQPQPSSRPAILKKKQSTDLPQPIPQCRTVNQHIKTLPPSSTVVTLYSEILSLIEQTKTFSTSKEIRNTSTIGKTNKETDAHLKETGTKPDQPAQAENTEKFCKGRILDKKKSLADAALEIIFRGDLPEHDRIECAMCKKMFDSLDGFKQHFDKFFCLQEIKCPICERRFYSSAELYNHFDKFHAIFKLCQCLKIKATDSFITFGAHYSAKLDKFCDCDNKIKARTPVTFDMLDGNNFKIKFMTQSWGKGNIRQIGIEYKGVKSISGSKKNVPCVHMNGQSITLQSRLSLVNPTSEIAPSRQSQSEAPSDLIECSECSRNEPKRTVLEKALSNPILQKSSQEIIHTSVSVQATGSAKEKVSHQMISPCNEETIDEGECAEVIASVIRGPRRRAGKLNLNIAPEVHHLGVLEEVKKEDTESSERLKGQDSKPIGTEDEEIKPTEIDIEIKHEDDKPLEIKDENLKPSESKDEDLKPSESKDEDLKPSEIKDEDSYDSYDKEYFSEDGAPIFWEVQQCDPQNIPYVYIDIDADNPDRFDIETVTSFDSIDAVGTARKE